MSVYRKKNPDGTLAATYTIKFRFQNEAHYIASGQTCESAARREEIRIKAELKRGRVEGVFEGLRQRKSLTVGKLITEYIAAGCPDDSLKARTGERLKHQTTQLQRALKWWADKDPNDLSQADCDDYWKWRCGKVTKGLGHRTTEIELSCLSGCFFWAERSRRIKKNLIANRKNYQHHGTVVHCRDRMPANGDELHKIAEAMLANRRSEVHGWQVLFECLTGLRTGEARALRWDAKRIGTAWEPGGIDDKFLYIQRYKRGINPVVRLDDPDRPNIRELLAAMKAWRDLRAPRSPWFFPSHLDHGNLPVTESSLSHCLKQFCAELKLEHVTSHGCRAYYCTARRGQGIDDSQIGYELGQRSGPELVRKVYGDPPANWQGMQNIYTWLPNTVGIEPAWRHDFKAKAAPLIQFPIEKVA